MTLAITRHGHVMTWRHYTMRAVYRDGSRTWSREFYAPTLDDAFTLARIEWPSAISWESL